MFASDRSHMLNDDGKYMEMPPDYPPIKTQGKCCYLCRMTPIKIIWMIIMYSRSLEKTNNVNLFTSNYLLYC